MIVTRLFLKLFLCEQPSAVAAGRQLKTVGWARALGRFLQFFSFAQRHQHTQTHQDYIQRHSFWVMAKEEEGTPRFLRGFRNSTSWNIHTTARPPELEQAANRLLLLLAALEADAPPTRLLATSSLCLTST
ncbi:hypothetical protein OUZ56_013494 [Daphnia magna]|uniref:Secreted protein n=1 Tax=Daphnia magna TaxID=35525 RepID=A0ABQ9Z620_9CRUS|nr:hypothetical protein OUZ56_013494 [Daphnia magna]